MNLKEVRIAGYAWALYQPFLADYTQVLSHDAFVQWASGSNIPRTDDAFAYWDQGVYDSRWLTHDDQYLSPSEIAERMGYDYEFILEEIVEGTLPAIDMAGKAAIWAPDARDWYNRLQNQ
jgi:hypothetical protein